MAASFSLLDIEALAPGLDSVASWQQWSLDGCWPEAVLPATPLIPAMTARRMSHSARLAVQLALQLLERWQPRHLLCVSRHGELSRTFTLLQKLIQQQPLSPTDFSMSVHNTVAGLTTIVGQRPLPASSLAAGVDSFHAGLLEACATLQAVSGPVLLLYFEGALPAFYQPWIRVPEPPHAIGMVLDVGEQWRYTGLETQEGSSLNQGLTFWRGHLQGATHVCLPGARGGRGWSCATQ
jgi:hypothetical protein